MADEKQESPWPVPKFHFKVTIGNKGEMSFQEVSGLDTEYERIEYRAGNSVDFSTVRKPGLSRSTDITFKKGMFKNDTALSDYFMEMKMNTIKRETVTIQLLDEEHNPMFTWILKNAWPLKTTEIDMNPSSGDVAIETLVLAHEGLSFEKA